MAHSIKKPKTLRIRLIKPDKSGTMKRARKVKV